ncbi:MAG: thiamine phosphate synthase [Pseudomonadota bacterium]|nr:thiamine phosphate synthase [Pseudomonadota bacterium]
MTPPSFGEDGPKAFIEPLKAALGAGPVACVQLRLKKITDNDLRRTCDTLRPIVQDHDVAFILNDRADLAAETGCDGVHVGQADLTCADARAIVGDGAIVGVTCKSSRDLAFKAGEAGADYVAFGAFFASKTKTETKPANIDILASWQQTMTLPCVAIGGITIENCETIIKAGADFLAVSGGVWTYPAGPAEAVKAFNKKMARGD